MHVADFKGKGFGRTIFNILGVNPLFQVTKMYLKCIIVALSVSNGFDCIPVVYVFCIFFFKKTLPINIVFYYSTAFSRVQITPKTSTNIPRYLYSRRPV